MSRYIFKYMAAASLLIVSSSQGSAIIGPQPATPPEVNTGEILISELNCIACHSVPDEVKARLQSRSSPFLGKTGIRMTPQFLKAYLSSPSSSKPGTTMPDLLHGLEGVEKSDMVEALVQYLISEQDNSETTAMGAEDFQIRQGQMLYHTIGCVACHEPQADPGAVPGITPDDPKGEKMNPALKIPASVPLGDLARKTTVEQLARFLLDPLKVRPGGRMPSNKLTPGEATSIAIYLLRAQAPNLSDKSQQKPIAGLKYHYYESAFQSGADIEKLTPKATGTAEKIELSHRLRNNGFGFRFSGSIRVPEDGSYTFYTLSDDGSLLYIDGNLVVSNDGDHAPEEKSGRVDLKSGEHSIVLTYYNNGAGFELNASWKGPNFPKQEIPGSVLSHFGAPMSPIDPVEFVLDSKKAAKGKEAFGTLGCAACHPVNDRSFTGYKSPKPLNELAQMERGCLADKPPKGVPFFDLDASQKEAIRSALREKSFMRSVTPRQEVVNSMTRLNCFACHTREGKGGPTDARLAYFRTVGNVDMGDEGRIPPHLTGVGAKLRPEWAREVLLNRATVRPYMATRMPQFGEANVGRLPAAFEKADQRESILPEPAATIRDAKFGRRLVGVGGLACISCHTFAGHPSLGIPAIDLTTVTTRLKYDWYHRYLIDPPSLRPGTRMPSFWPGGEAVNKEILKGDTEAQITAIWAYLSGGKSADLPNGLVQGRKEIIADKEPVVYRNFIAGAGSRAIAVGYPEKVNLAFDANNIRLAMIWQGSFIDASRHSNGRGEGYEPPLGNNIMKFPEASPFAILQNANSPWPEIAGKEAGFRMRGYQLDQARRPAFFYDFKDVQIEENFEPVMGEIDAYFRRAIDLNSAHPLENLWFRAAVGKIVRNGNVFIQDKKLTLSFKGGEPLLRDSNGEQELLIPIKFNGSHAHIEEEIIW